MAAPPADGTMEEMAQMTVIHLLRIVSNNYECTATMLFSIGKKNTALIWYGLLYFFLAPLTLFAQSTDLPKDATELLNRISTFIINPIIYLLFAAAFVIFVWGLVQFVAHLDNEEARSTGGKHMIWGIIGMVIMVSVNGIIYIIQNTILQLGS